MIGLSTNGNISFGWALVAGKKRVPNPAAGKMALRTLRVLRRSPSVRRSCCVIAGLFILISGTYMERRAEIQQPLRWQGSLSLAARMDRRPRCAPGLPLSFLQQSVGDLCVVW